MKYVYLVKVIDKDISENPILSSIQSSEKKAKAEVELWRKIAPERNYYYIKEPVY